MVVVALGFILVTVLVTSLIKKAGWNPKGKHFLAVLISVVGAGLTVVFTKGGLDALLTRDLMESVLIVYGGSQAFYGLFMNDTQADAKLEAVGSKKNTGAV